MASSSYRVSGEPTIIWVYPDALTQRLDSATWVETTRQLTQFGWDVTLLTRDPEPGPQSFRGLEIISLKSRDVYLIGQLLFHLNVLRTIWQRRRQTDIVFFSQLSGFWLLLPLRLMRLLTFRKRPLLVMDTRDLDDPEPGNLRIALRIIFHKIVFRMAAFFADGQTAITYRMAELVGIPREQLWGIWPSGVDPEKLATSFTKRSWPTDGEPVQIVYLGILLPNRHPVELCRAIEHVNSTGKNVELSLVGDGPERFALESLVEASSGRIRIVPPVPHEQIPAVLARAHVGVTSLPDPDDVIYQASSPIKLFEYMAAGLPVLATRNVCHTAVIGDGEFAFWADAATEPALTEAITAIWEKRSELEELGSLAQEAVHDWTWEAAAKKLSVALEGGLASAG